MMDWTAIVQRYARAFRCRENQIVEVRKTFFVLRQSPGCTGTYCVDPAGFEFTELCWPLPSESWEERLGHHCKPKNITEILFFITFTCVCMCICVCECMHLCMCKYACVYVCECHTCAGRSQKRALRQEPQPQAAIASHWCWEPNSLW